MEEQFLKDKYNTGEILFLKHCASMIEDAKNDIFCGINPPWFEGDVRAIKDKSGKIQIEIYHSGQWENSETNWVQKD
jgi:hypothetical protein